MAFMKSLAIKGRINIAKVSDKIRKAVENCPYQRAAASFLIILSLLLGHIILLPYNKNKEPEIVKYAFEAQLKEDYMAKYRHIYKIFPYSKIEYKTLEKIVIIANEVGIDPDLAIAMTFKESNFNPKCISKAGAVGLTQLMKETAIEMGLTVNGKIDERKDPEKNLVAGLEYYKKLDLQVREYFGDEYKPEYTLAAYNAGLSNIKKYNGIPPFEETQNHVQDVYHYYNLLKNL